MLLPLKVTRCNGWNSQNSLKIASCMQLCQQKIQGLQKVTQDVIDITGTSTIKRSSSHSRSMASSQQPPSKTRYTTVHAEV